MSPTRHRHRMSAPPTVRRLPAHEPTLGCPPMLATDRDPLAPPPTSTTRRGARPRGLARVAGGCPRPTRSWVLAIVAVSLVVLLGGTLAVHADAAPTTPPAGTQPAPPPPLPLPLPTGDACDQTVPVPSCLLPTSPAPGATAPAPTAPPCTGEGCIPQPTTAGSPTSAPATTAPGSSSGDADCGITNIGGCITNAITGFFRGLVTDALNPLLDLLSATLLTTPTLDSLPRVGQLWNTSWQILLLAYALLVLIAGVLVMGHETVQTRYDIKQIAPRIVLGFLAAALSLWAASTGIEIANSLARAVLDGGLDANSAGDTLRDLVLGALNGGIFIIFVGVALAGMVVVLLVTYIVRVALTIILIAGAPLALMFHALPQTAGIATWWWKAYVGVLAIQIGQSLTLITALRVFLAPDGFTLFGPTRGGLVNLLVALALLYILIKIPFWVLGSLRGGGGRSLVGSLLRGFIAYKTFGLLGGRGRAPRPAGRSGGTGSTRGSGGGGPVDPYARPRTTTSGQYLLPLAGVRRTRPVPPPRPAAPPPKAGGVAGRQLALPLGDDWPENKPVLGRDGQYRLPLDVHRVTPTPPPPDTGQPAPRGGRRRGRQLRFEFDPYHGNRPTHTGQYPLPLGVTRTPPTTSPPPPTAPTAPPSSRRRGRQLELPFDPYHGNRPTRTGQYPLPLDGVHRVPPTPPAPPPPPTPPAPAPPPRPAPRAGRQLRLPLDLPAPPRSTPPPKPTTGDKP